jgi:hypothetical protein
MADSLREQLMLSNFCTMSLMSFVITGSVQVALGLSLLWSSMAHDSWQGLPLVRL